MNFGRTELDNFDVDNGWDIIDLFEQKIKLLWFTIWYL